MATRPHTAGGGRIAAIAASRGLGGGDDDMHTLRSKLSLLETDRKSFFESSQAELRRNKEEIRRLRSENSELKTTINASKKSGASVQDKEIEQLDRSIYVSTLKLDRLQAEAADQRSLIDEQLHNLGAIQTESEPLLTDGSYLAKRIRMLENRLDKSLIKYNEALAIKKTYEHIVERLSEERVGFDNQLAAIEKTLQAKDHDYQELLKMSHAANHAKEAAKKDLQDFKASFDDSRKAKDRELAERKLFVQGKVDQTQRLEKKEKALRQKEAEDLRAKQEEELGRHNAKQSAVASLTQRDATLSPEEEQRLSQYEEAFRAISEGTGITDVNELLVKYVSQEETHRNLETMAREAQHRIDDLHVEKAELTAKLEELRYTGSGQLGSRRIVEEFELHLQEAAQQTESNSQRYEQLARLLIDVKAGVEHLTDKVAVFKPEMTTPAIADETVVEVLKIVEQKLVALADEVVPTDTAEEALITTTVELPLHNRRVKILGGDDDDHDDGAAELAEDPDDDAVLKRDQVKKISANSIQRETKKLRKKRGTK
jgi:coiled-coil domain-containing protein 151